MEMATVAWTVTLGVLGLGAIAAEAGAARFRKPAPREDRGRQIEFPVFGRAAGLDDTDSSLGVMQWVAKRIWHVLGLPYERQERAGPPSLQLTCRDGWVEVAGTVCDGGVPLRNQVITCQIDQMDEPLLVVLRSTDAFGEVLIELGLKGGTARARSITVSRSMIGGQSHSSPMPEQSHNHIVATAMFRPPPAGPVELKIKALGARVTVWANGRRIFSFVDPDPAGGKFGFGSTGTMRVRDVQQWELITEREQRRREACLREMYDFCKQIDRHHDDDVRKRNRVEAEAESLTWTWPATGATARFRADGPRMVATVRSGLYGDWTLVDGAFPEVVVVGADGEEYRADPDQPATLEGDDLGLRMTLPLRSPSGKTAAARVTARFTVQTIWFWTIEVEGVQPKTIQAFVGLAPGFEPEVQQSEGTPEAVHGLVPLTGHSMFRHNCRAGFYLKATEPETTVLGTRPGGEAEIGISTSGAQLRFATVILPAQPLNRVGFTHRMVHYIRYPEGPVQHWRRAPSFQEYPTNVDLMRYRANGTGAMVWHHTWLNSDFRDREGFLVNHAEMKRAMDETHRLGMKMIGYLGLVPGRSSLLRFEDTGPLGGGRAYGGYDKNWDLQDQTFYHVAGRYPEFLVWMTEYWCREYGLDGFYLDGGSLGLLARGAATEPLHPEDAGLTLDEIRYRAYYRVKKVLELNGAGYGLEPWSGLDWMLVGFYDCMMIGESFQEAAPEYYRDGHNALLTGCTVKMYGMRESSQNPYNIAMAAVNLGDIQVCSGNGAWGDDPDTTDTWARVRPLWDLLAAIDWDSLVEARPWYAQDLVSGEGFYAGNYTERRRALVFLANQTEQPARCQVTIDPARLPEIPGTWQMRYCLGREGAIGPLGDGKLTVELPPLHDGPIGIELVAAD